MMISEAPFFEQGLSWVRSLAQENAIALMGLLLILLLVQSIRLVWQRGAAARRIGRHQRLGAAGEKRALSLLERRGYRLCGEQVGGKYEIHVNGQPRVVHLRADFLVKRGGKRFVAEVKSGAESSKVAGRATRRQLLEYLFAFDVHGVLLVDMYEGQVHEVEFPKLLRLESDR